ncbi:hypothetical protein AB3S75_040778, partial [Citrus x aurantiifolia]
MQGQGITSDSFPES